MPTLAGTPAPASPDASPSVAPDHATPAIELEQAILLTVLYGDLFDYPLTADEIRRYLLVAVPGRERFDAALERLTGRRLRCDGGLYCFADREALPALRRRREALAAGRWRAAHGFGRWLRRLPFVRMVAVCGSQAVENGDADGDVDLFLITAPRRLWLAQAATMTLRRLARWRFGVEFCPNFLTTLDHLELAERGLYTAREIAQAVPLWGPEAWRRFQDANGWIAAFLPQLAAEPAREAPETPAPRATRLLERLLGGRLGHLLEGAVYRTLLAYYAWRLRGRGWTAEDVRAAYTPDRQGLITGGYAAAVARRFVERGRERFARDFDGTLDGAALESWFYRSDGRAASGEAGTQQPDPHFADLFATRYGGDLDGG